MAARAPGMTRRCRKLLQTGIRQNEQNARRQQALSGLVENLSDDNQFAQYYLTLRRPITPSERKKFIDLRRMSAEIFRIRDANLRSEFVGISANNCTKFY